MVGRRHGGRALLAALLLPLLAACSHLQGRAGVPGALAGAAPADAAEPAQDADAPGSLDVATLDGAPADLALPDTGEPDAAADARDFDDLLERMRAGFALPEVDRPAVTRELDWYADHAAYLDRTFKRGRRYLHFIVEALEQRDMPTELALLPVVESAFDPFAHSPCRASGLWQFLPSTGRRYGLHQNWWVDARRDVLEATRAALDHLQELREEFGGDWLLAIAAYNAGAGSVERAIERNRRRGRPTDFFHLDLPRETRAYVPKLLAIARLVAQPEAYGVELPAIPNAPYFARVDLDAQVDLGLVADLGGIPREELRALNPEFNRWATAPGGPRRLLVPARDRERFEEVLATLPARQRLRLVHHRVRRGDTLIGIAHRYGTSVHALRAVNHIRGSLIRAGHDLLVPLPYAPGAAAALRQAGAPASLASRD